MLLAYGFTQVFPSAMLFMQTANSIMAISREIRSAILFNELIFNIIY